ncbi:uncharacterized protein [Palaemon carinicauda]|uniref:uncharacterized protein n=1 Tax=Palaemon carinicauda TaxID=392227 RepID=UPI0035B5F588
MSVSCTSVLLSGWIARFGIPDHIISDRGTTFTSKFWTSLANILGISLLQTTSYKAAANGMVEHFQHTVKAALMSLCKDSNWFTLLPWVVLEIRTTPKDTPDVSAAEMVYGDLLVVTARFFPYSTFSDDLQRIYHVVGKFTPCSQTYKPPVKHHMLTDLHSVSVEYIN